MATANFIQGSEWQLTYRKPEWMLDTDKHTQRFMGQFLRIKRPVHQHPQYNIVAYHVCNILQWYIKFGRLKHFCCHNLIFL